MNLADLITAAAGGTATLTTPDGAGTPISLAGAARVAATVDEDRIDMSLGLLPDLPQCSVALEEVWDDAPVVVVHGVLRYLIEEDLRFTRLCVTAGCHNERIGRRLSTSVCMDHVDNVLPNAGDDILPDLRERAAAESRTRRLDVLDEEIADRQRDLNADRRWAEKLRQTSTTRKEQAL